MFPLPAANPFNQQAAKRGIQWNTPSLARQFLVVCFQLPPPLLRNRIAASDLLPFPNSFIRFLVVRQHAIGTVGRGR
jgi:hypothetical protein